MPREDAQIRADYLAVGAAKLAHELDRSWLSVVQRAFRIGVIDTSLGWKLLDDMARVDTLAAGGIVIDMPGDPVAWMRAGQRGDRSFTPKRVAEAEAKLAARFATLPTFRRNVSLHCVFFRGTMRSADADNLMKLVLDAGNDGALWEDDSQVTTTSARVTLDRSLPRTVITVQEYADPAMPRGSGYLPRCEGCGEPFRRPERKTKVITTCSEECFLGVAQEQQGLFA
jgi:Holliday junction resolvase RusA-like endonuclease